MVRRVKNDLERLVTEKIRDCFGSKARLKSLIPLSGDASSRHYYRASVSGKGLPHSVVVMKLSGGMLPLSSEELAVFKEPPRELPFLNLHRFLTKVEVRIPALYGHWVEDGILLLEDLGDRSLWDSVQGLSPKAITHWYEKAIDQLLGLQIRGTRSRDDSCFAFQQRFDFRLYMWEFEHFIEYGIEKGKKGSMDKRERKCLVETFSLISRQLEKQPAYLNHRDYHSWNLMVSQEELVMIDFQDALLAPLQYDLASLLNDRETDRLIQPDLEGHLLDYYLGSMEEMGERKGTRDEFLENYLLSVLQRDFKVVGRFIYLDLVKGKPQYKKYLPPTLQRIERNLRRLPQLEKLVSILAPYFEDVR